MWRDHEHRISSSGRGSFDFVDSADDAVLPCAHDERLSVRNCRAGGFDHFEILAFIEMNAFPSRAEDDVTTDARSGPAADVRTQHCTIDNVSTKRRGDRQK